MVEIRLRDENVLKTLLVFFYGVFYLVKSLKLLLNKLFVLLELFIIEDVYRLIQFF